VGPLRFEHRQTKEIIMPARLVALDEGPDIPLNRSVTFVGRHFACDARLDSRQVSRRHCCVALEGDTVVVRDLGSTNGTRINGLRVIRGHLGPGDVVSIADHHFRFDDGLDSDRDPDRSLAPPTISCGACLRQPANALVLDPALGLELRAAR
jgi:pSer/pThr/pTyr-binding forkhead associated (FHA) protein